MGLISVSCGLVRWRDLHDRVTASAVAFSDEAEMDRQNNITPSYDFPIGTKFIVRPQDPTFGAMFDVSLLAHVDAGSNVLQITSRHEGIGQIKKQKLNQ